MGQFIDCKICNKPILQLSAGKPKNYCRGKWLNKKQYQQSPCEYQYRKQWNHDNTPKPTEIIRYCKICNDPIIQTDKQKPRDYCRSTKVNNRYIRSKCQLEYLKKWASLNPDRQAKKAKVLRETKTTRMAERINSEWERLQERKKILLKKGVGV